MKKVHVLQPTRQRPDHQPDHSLDLAIAQHQARLNARLARHMLNSYANNSKRGFRS